MLETIYLPITFVISIFEDFRGHLSVPYDQFLGLGALYDASRSR